MTVVDKPKIITLSRGWENGEGIRYRVESITNSIEYEPGQYLTHAEVESLCNAIGWQVNIMRIPQ
jgi:hypothetical protein